MTSPATPHISLEGVRLHRNGRHILDNITARFHARALIGLIGPNGAGKTTLLRIITGLVRPDAGRVHLEGAPLTARTPNARARAIAYLPQNLSIHWPLRVRDLVMLGRLPHRALFRPTTSADMEAVDAAMEEADIAHLAERTADTLSGGEARRVALARAWATQAACLIADEPVAALDPYHQIEVMERLRDHAHAGTCSIVVLQDLTLAARFCDRILLLKEGRLIAEGPSPEILTAERLADAYRVKILHGQHEGEDYILPWKRLAYR